MKYYDEDGGAIDGLPGQAGNYFVEAVFSGCQIGSIVYEPCTLRVSYEIKPALAKVSWFSLTPLLVGTAVWFAWIKSGNLLRKNL